MQVHHVILLVVVLIGGYVLGRYWSTPATLIGLQ